MAGSLKLKAYALTWPPAVFTLGLLLLPMSSALEVKDRLRELESSVRNAVHAGAFETALTRQHLEVFDLAFLAEESRQGSRADFVAARTASRAALKAWIHGERDEEIEPDTSVLRDLRTVQVDLAALERSMDEILEVAAKGERERAIGLADSKLELFGERQVLTRASALVGREFDVLLASMHRLEGRLGSMGPIAGGLLHTASAMDHDLHQVILANRFEAALVREVLEYLSIAILGETRENSFLAAEAAESALAEWTRLVVARDDTDERAELATLRKITADYASVKKTGAQILDLLDTGNSEEAWRLIETQLEAQADDALLPLVEARIRGEIDELEESLEVLAERTAGTVGILFVIVALLLVAAIGGPWLLARRVIAPIVQLTRATARVGLGGGAEAVAVRSDDEIGQLGTSFNSMSHRLALLHEELEKQVADANTINGLLSAEVVQRQKAEARLVQARDGLEKRVRERTVDLERSEQRARRADDAKTSFLANMSHEIRTPMTAILGYAEHVLDASLSRSEMREAIETIRRNGEFLLSIINDILDLSKIEAGMMAIECVSVEPCRLIAEVLSLIRVSAESKGLSLDWEAIGPLPQTIRTDPTRLRQVLINLLGNAIKFTEVGGVRLVASLAGDGPAAELRFDVIDTGRGMSALQVSQLFKPFSQADASTTREHGGTGLGLTISKRFAQMLGGELVVRETRKGAGTTFRLTIAPGCLVGTRMIEDPRSATVVADTNEGAYGRQPRGLEGRRVLLVEDGPDNQRLIAHVLEKTGADVQVEANGELGVDAALDAREDGRPFDLILMDMQMPVMDGYAASSTLRGLGYGGAIVALTAHAMEGDRERCLRAGCDEYATKPIDRRVLFETLERLLHPRLGPALR